MFDNVRHVHLVGAGGIGVSAIGKWFLARGVSVSGSDVVRSDVTDDLAARGAVISIGHDAKNVPALCDILVYTEAASEENPERAEAVHRGIRQLGHFDFLGELSRDMRTICVTGTHGKSTTTTMVGKIFEAAGLDPTVFVGSMVPGWELGNVRIGKSDILIVEGDEYKRKVLALHPETTLITNIELDHTDVYDDIEDVKAMFAQLERQTRVLVLHAPEALEASRRSFADGIQRYRLSENDMLELAVPGVFNMLNALGAKAVADAYEIPFSITRETLRAFPGIWRRFERVGYFLPHHPTIPPSHSGIPVISDYAHHPTAIKATLAAAKEFFPGKRIVLCFQPHQHNRTRGLFDDFVGAFRDADVLVLAEIYGVEGRSEGEGAISSADILAAMPQGVPLGTRVFAKTCAEAEAHLRRLARAGDVILVMGAGDIDTVARSLVTCSSPPF